MFSEKALVAAIAAVSGAGMMYIYNNHVRGDDKRRNKRRAVIPPELLATEYREALQVAVELALQAGDNMYEYCNARGTTAAAESPHHDLGIVTKGQPEDFCTKVDLENERLITDGLLQKFPRHQIIGEETTGQGPIPDITDAPCWIIDPVDGTTNFASGLPLTCVSIGFCRNRQPVLGVVYAPMTDELYIAVAGHGAYRNGIRLTSSQPQPNKTLLDSVVCFEFGYARSKEAVAKMLKVVENIMVHGCRTTRSLGSGVLDLCYVATGRIDVVYAGVASEGWKPWDYCAGLVVAREAGCVVQAIDQPSNDDFDLYSNSIICAVGRPLLGEVRQKIRQ